MLRSNGCLYFRVQTFNLAQKRTDETVDAFRRELGELPKERSDRNAKLADLRTHAWKEIDDSEGVQERDTLHMEVRDMQEEIEKRTEMLARAAIDALADESKVRRFEDGLLN